jgi:hypothetical protein
VLALTGDQTTAAAINGVNINVGVSNCSSTASTTWVAVGNSSCISLTGLGGYLTNQPATYFN